MFRLLCLLFTGSLVLLLAGGAALSIAGRGGGHLLATYTNGNLSVTIPYRAAHSGKGKIVAEVVDPEDHVLGKVERSAEIKNNHGQPSTARQISHQGAHLSILSL